MSVSGLGSRSQSRKESEVFGWSRIPNNTGSRSQIFFRLRLWMFNWIIFYITLLNWEFLLKWYNFFWNCCWNRFLAVHHDLHWLLQPKFIPYMLRSRSRKFWKVGVEYFTSDSATLVRMLLREIADRMHNNFVLQQTVKIANWRGWLDS